MKEKFNFRLPKVIEGTVMLNSILPAARGPLMIVNYLASPMAVLYFIALFAGSESVNFALSGGLLMVIISNAFYLIGDASYYKIELKFQDIVVSSPITAFQYALSLAVSELIFAIPGIVIFSALLLMRGLLTVQNCAIYFFVILLTWASLSALAFTVSTYIKDFRYAWQITTLTSMFFSFLPPVFYPIELIPEWIRWLAYLVPTTYPALLVHAASGLTHLSFAETLSYWIILAGITAAFSEVGRRRMRWREA
jgi:ABC-2 type transport system permease protein